MLKRAISAAEEGKDQLRCLEAACELAAAVQCAPLPAFHARVGPGHAAAALESHLFPQERKPLTFTLVSSADKKPIGSPRWILMASLVCCWCAVICSHLPRNWVTWENRKGSACSLQTRLLQCPLNLEPLTLSLMPGLFKTFIAILSH